MSARRRYDTTELVDDIRRTKLKALGFAVGGLSILGLLILLVLGQLGEDRPPAYDPSKEDMSLGGTTTTQSGDSLEQGSMQSSEMHSKKSGETLESESSRSNRARVSVILPRAGQIWLDGELLGSYQEHEIQVSPGRHMIKAKIGKRVLSHQFSTASGRSYELRIDSKRKKQKIKIVD